MHSQNQHQTGFTQFLNGYRAGTLSGKKQKKKIIFSFIKGIAFHPHFPQSSIADEIT
jgi:hypothetical protein